MNFKKQILAGLAITCTLAFNGCGGNVYSPATPGDTLGASTTALTPITPLDGGMEPIEGFGDPLGEGALPGDIVDAAPADAALTDAAPADAAPADAAPADAAPADAAPADTAEPLLDAGLTDVPADGEAVPNLNETGGDLPDFPDLEVLPPFNPSGGSGGGNASYSLTANLKVDRDMLNQWQAVNVTSDGGTLYVAAIDQKSLAKGTVIQMDASSGEGWKNLGRNTLKSIFTLGLAGYAMKKSIRGIALDSSGNVVVNDTEEFLYQLTAPKYSVNKVSAGISGGIDVASTFDSVFVATSSGIQKFDSSLSGGSPFGSVNLTGGIGTDSQGNVYAVSGSTIKKIDSSGNASDVITSDLSSPLDVAVHSNGNIFVLESGSVKEFKSNGELQGQFGAGDFTQAMGIFVDPVGAVLIADIGNSHKDSQILKYEAGGFSTMSGSGYVSTMNAPDVAE